MALLNVLVIDDDYRIRRQVNSILTKSGMLVHEASGDKEAFKYLKQKKIDLIIVDLVMDGLSGFEIVQEIRRTDSLLPILILSGQERMNDRVVGLGLGADDYISKPFHPLELVARVKAHARRSMIQKGSVETITEGSFLLDIERHQFTKKGRPIDLTSKEFEIMHLFMINPDQVFTKKQILQKIWKDTYPNDNIVTANIKNLRKKIEEDSSSPLFLQTVWGVGYRFSISSENGS